MNFVFWLSLEKNALLKLIVKGIIPYFSRFIGRVSVLTCLLLMCFQFTLGQLKIVPLGNSITQGNISYQGANSYRRNLWHKLNNADYNVDFVGSLDTDNNGRTFPDATFDHDHEGHWGWRADEILADLTDWLTGYTPDVALIHLGSNDAIQANTVASTLDEIEDIIGILRNDNSRIVIFLSRILPLENADWNEKVEGINAGLVNLASNLDEAQSRIILVDQNSGWSTADHTYDGVHPNLAGEERMAQRWFNAFDAFYSSGNEAPEITGQSTLSVNEDLPLTLSVADFTISDPDTDPGGMSLTVYGGSHYSVNGTTITPDQNWYGTLSVQVTVNDGVSDSDPFDATLMVIPVNDAPVVTDIPDQTINQGERFEIIHLGMYVEDFETSDSHITWSVEGAAKLSVLINDQEAAISILDDNWTGTETIVFFATDDDPGGSLSSSDEVRFSINAPVSVDITEMGSVGLYPNPSEGEFIIDTYGEPRDLILVIYDSQGRILKRRKYENVSKLSDNLYAYPSGLYQIKIISRENIRQLKYLKH